MRPLRPAFVMDVEPESAQTRLPAAGNVDPEGGGSIPTLDRGGGARARVPERAVAR